LRSIGNNCLVFENTLRLLKQGFLATLSKLLKKIDYTERAEVIRYSCDVLANISSHFETQQVTAIDALIKEDYFNILSK
jgi:hypothetical protein